MALGCPQPCARGDAGAGELAVVQVRAVRRALLGPVQRGAAGRGAALPRHLPEDRHGGGRHPRHRARRRGARGGGRRQGGTKYFS